MPKRGPEKAKGYLYPDEDAWLLGCAAVPLCWRVFYGFLHRQGPRLSEAMRLELQVVDLVRGALALDRNKTDDPRAWALRPDTARALHAWVGRREREAGAPLPPSAPLFVDEEVRALVPGRQYARRFRDEHALDSTHAHRTGRRVVTARARAGSCRTAPSAAGPRSRPRAPAVPAV